MRFISKQARHTGATGFISHFTCAEKSFRIFHHTGIMWFFSVQPPLCSYIGLMLFTAAAFYSFISLLIYPHALPVCLIACIFEILYITNIKWQITACEEKIIRHLRDQTELIQRADSEIE